MAARRPKPGDEISVTYQGKKFEVGTYMKYHSYRVLGGQVSGV